MRNFFEDWKYEVEFLCAWPWYPLIGIFTFVMDILKIGFTTRYFCYCITYVLTITIRPFGDMEIIKRTKWFLTTRVLSISNILRFTITIRALGLFVNVNINWKGRICWAKKNETDYGKSYIILNLFTIVLMPAKVCSIWVVFLHESFVIILPSWLEAKVNAAYK